MPALMGRILSRLLLPVVLFLFIGVPMETIVRGMDGLFSASRDMSALVQEHLFFEAAACFYCITVLLEIIVILSRPHIRSREGIPVETLNRVVLFAVIFLTASYIWIRVNIERGDFEPQAAQIFLIIALVGTTIMSLVVHALDYMSSSEVAPAPKSRRAKGRAQ